LEQVQLQEDALENPMDDGANDAAFGMAAAAFSI
jgi:hypothetical protein